MLSFRRAGCPSCYRAFSAALSPLLRLVEGRGEPGAARTWRRERALKARLEEALLVENYEEAARLRDRLARLKAGTP